MVKQQTKGAKKKKKIMLKNNDGVWANDANMLKNIGV